MASIQLETRVSANTLLNAIEQMSSRDLARLQKRVMKLSAQRRAAALPQKESRLLVKINQLFAEQDIYNELILKRREATLTSDEHAALIRLTERNEAFMVERLRALTQLANHCKVPLAELMKSLGIARLAYA